LEPAAGATAGDWAVHVASYKKTSQAEKEIDQLRKYGYDGRAIQTDLGSKGVWFRVYVGSCTTSAEANALREKLLQLPGYDFAQVRRLPRD
jgi:cell division septation protein DedD